MLLFCFRVEFNNYFNFSYWNIFLNKIFTALVRSSYAYRREKGENMKLKTFLIIIFFIAHGIAQAEDAKNVIISLLQQYKRPVTVLEIGNHATAGTLHRAAHCRGSYVMMVRHKDSIADKMQNGTVSLHNLVVLHPDTIDYAIMDNLGKCEHFDVVVIRDMDKWFTHNILYGIFKAALTLGDYLFVELNEALIPMVTSLHPCTVMESTVPRKVWCYFEIHKKYLKKARWTLHEENINNFEIISNFDEKKMYKHSTNTTSSWIPGINLVTFIMLKGLYPTDTILCSQLKSFKTLKHNDLVVGNIVVQGKRIRAIDFCDARRNISPSICIRAAIKKLIYQDRLKKDPLHILRKYTEYLLAHKRGVHL